MQANQLKADCTKCVGLCCVALRFERADGFGHDKAAGAPCHFLQTDFRCAIHARKQELGYEGCEDFDCLGAGQRASAAFAALNWQRDPGIARRLQARFAQLLDLQHLRKLLTEALEDNTIQADRHEIETALDQLTQHAETQNTNATQQETSDVANAKIIIQNLRE